MGVYHNQSDCMEWMNSTNLKPFPLPLSGLNTPCWMSAPALWALTWKERFSRPPKMPASPCSPSHTDPPCGKPRHTGGIFWSINANVVGGRQASSECSREQIFSLFLILLPHLQEVPHPPAAVWRGRRLALWAAGHGNAPLPHRGEAAAGGPAGRHSRDAESPQRALQDPRRRLCPKNSWGVRGEVWEEARGGKGGLRRGEKKKLGVVEEVRGNEKAKKSVC